MLIGAVGTIVMNILFGAVSLLPMKLKGRGSTEPKSSRMFICLGAKSS